MVAIGAGSSDRAAAHGAVAEAYWRDGSTQRYAYGLLVGVGAADRARSEALAACRTSASSPAGAAKCEIVSTFNGSCIATASTGDVSGVSAWALASSEVAARDKALELCKESASFRSSDCRITNAFCDVTGVGSPFVDGKASNVFPEPTPLFAKVLGGLVVAVAVLGLLGFLVSKLIAFLGDRKAAGAVSNAPWPQAGRSAAPDPGLYPTHGPPPQPHAAPPRGPAPQPAAGTLFIPTLEVSLVPTNGGPALFLDPGRLAAGGVIAGRGQGCDLIIQEPTLSGRHARFWLDPEGVLRVEDLGSTNGTGRNGQAVQRASLKDGDQLRLASAHFTVSRR